MAELDAWHASSGAKDSNSHVDFELADPSCHKDGREEREHVGRMCQQITKKMPWHGLMTTSTAAPTSEIAGLAEAECILAQV